MEKTYLQLEQTLATIRSNYLSLKELINKNAITEEEITKVADDMMQEIKNILKLTAKQSDQPFYLTKEHKKRIKTLIDLIKPYSSFFVAEEEIVTF